MRFGGAPPALPVGGVDFACCRSVVPLLFACRSFLWFFFCVCCLVYQKPAEHKAKALHQGDGLGCSIERAREREREKERENKKKRRRERERECVEATLKDIGKVPNFS